ncbi:MAG: hypothetical protein IJ222_07905 [Bacteroidales bacterium]|nr:hypothetical protein [Bacteroidales bacterium]
MENRINEMQGWLLVGVTCLLAVSLAVNAVMALFGLAGLAWWHWSTLAMVALLTWESLTERQTAAIAAFMKDARKKAATAVSHTYLHIRRAVRGLSALFIVNSPNRPQTEP